MYSRSLFHTWLEALVLRFRLGMLCGLCLGGREKLRRWLSDWVEDILLEDRFVVEGGVVGSGLSVVFEVRCRNIWWSPYDSNLSVADDDDQQVEIAGRKPLKGLPLKPHSLAFGLCLTREHVMPTVLRAPVERRNIPIQRLRRHG